MSQIIIFLVGRVGQNPEIRTYQSGKSEIKLSLGVKRGSSDNVTDWFNLFFHGKTGETVANTIRKGDLISITGTINLDQWKDKSGEKRIIPKVMVRSFLLIESKSKTATDMSKDFLVSKIVRDDPPVFKK